MLAIDVELLTGRFVAQAYNSRSVSEWPPHPARLFSSIVATHFSSETPDPDERDVLAWLESQGAPDIVASDATPREVVTVFVPVNDVALTNVDEEAQQVEGARAELAKAGGTDRKTVKTRQTALTRAETRLAAAISRATSVPSGFVNPRYGTRLLPEFRGRQPRTFPSLTPAVGPLQYVWPRAAPTDRQRAVLDGLLRRVVRLGHSSTLVSIRVTASPAASVWQPALGGELTLRVVEAGQVAALEQAFARHGETEPRVLPFVPQGYSRVTADGSKPIARSIFSTDWLVLRRVEGPALPMTAAAGVARSVRKTLMSLAEEPLPEMLSGHTTDGRPSERPHLAIVPLSFVGHEHASGTILGIALILPKDASAQERRSIYAAVARWEADHRQEGEDTPRVPLNLGAAGVLHLERVEWASVPATLTATTWTRAARVWFSATPVALDRNPGDLQSRDPRKLADALEEATETVAHACQRINLPRPKYVEILPFSSLANAAKARLYPPYPEDPSRTRRVLTHVRIEFDQLVEGPILIGSGRYLGLGLFRPESPR